MTTDEQLYRVLSALAKSAQTRNFGIPHEPKLRSYVRHGYTLALEEVGIELKKATE